MNRELKGGWSKLVVVQFEVHLIINLKALKKMTKNLSHNRWSLG